MPAGILTVDAWNTEDSCSFDCKTNRVLHQHFLRQEPIPVLLLIDKDAVWNQELENVYLVSHSRLGSNSEHYEYELRPEP